MYLTHVSFELVLLLAYGMLPPSSRFWKLFDAREAKLTKNSKIQNPYTVSRLAELTAATRTHLKEHRLQAAVIDCWISDRDHVLVLHLDPSRGLRLACIQ